MSAIPFNSGWSYRTPVGPFGEVPGAAVEITPVHLPHDALRDELRSPTAPSKGHTAYYPNGAYSYVKRFPVPAEWKGRLVRLEIEGAYRKAQVFLNNEFVGNRADGYARFFVDLTPYLRYGADNELRIEVRTLEDSRWYSGSGLHRPVWLHVDEPLHIVPDGIAVETLRIEDDQAVVEVRSTLRNAGVAAATVRVRTEIVDVSGVVVEQDSTPSTLVGGEEAVVRQRFYVQDPALWSPGAPHLHTLRTYVGDSGSPTTVTFGIRTVTADPKKGLRINGEKVLLRGASIHHDNGPLGAAAIARADERRVELLKEAGYNAIRSAHNPISKATLDAADRLGVLVMDEAFDMWTRFKSTNDYATDFPQWWQDDLTSLVLKDRNHPSVILYSLGNEIAETGSRDGARWARRMAEHIRSIDDSRLITNGVNALLSTLDDVQAVVTELGGLNEAMAAGDHFGAVSGSKAAGDRIEESSAALDVLGLNYGEVRYQQDAENHPHRVIVGSESFPTRIGILWPLIQESPNVVGDFSWTGWDYLGEVGVGAITYGEKDPDVISLEHPYPSLTAYAGDIDITGHRRPASYYREIVYGLRTDPYIAVGRPQHHGEPIANQSPWAWNDVIASWTWKGFEDEPVHVEVYADADEVALLLDGEEIGRSTVHRGAVGEVLPFVATFETVYRPGSLQAVSYRGGEATGRTTLETAGDPVLTATADREGLVADDGDLAFVAIEFRDAEGRIVSDCDQQVTVRVVGPGALAGMASADPVTEERLGGDTWKTFDGRALAVIRPAGAGEIVVTVSSEGHPDAVVTLVVAAPEPIADATDAVRAYLDAAAPRGFSVESTVSELLAHEGARAVLEQHVGQLFSDPRLAVTRPMPLSGVAALVGEVLSDSTLEEIGRQLAELAD